MPVFHAVTEVADWLIRSAAEDPAPGRAVPPYSAVRRAVVAALVFAGALSGLAIGVLG